MVLCTKSRINLFVGFAKFLGNTIWLRDAASMVMYRTGAQDLNSLLNVGAILQKLFTGAADWFGS